MTYPNSITLQLDISKSISETLNHSFPGIDIDGYSVTVDDGMIYAQKTIKESEYVATLTAMTKTRLEEEPKVDIEVGHIPSSTIGSKISLGSGWMCAFDDYISELEDAFPFRKLDLYLEVEGKDHVTIYLLFRHKKNKAKNVAIPMARVNDIKILRPSGHIENGFGIISNKPAITGVFTKLL